MGITVRATAHQSISSLVIIRPSHKIRADAPAICCTWRKKTYATLSVVTDEFFHTRDAGHALFDHIDSARADAGIFGDLGLGLTKD
ncbi:hypothetical protein ASG39_11830 [Rhizobium sp. Leaf371]|nr:hypothetical protein ASG39_11830 [Rhizobium sp. Leaf371]